MSLGDRTKKIWCVLLDNFTQDELDAYKAKLNATAYRKLIHNMQPSLLLRIIILCSLANQIKT